MTIQIAEYKVEELNKKVEQFNRKAVKLGLPVVQVTELAREIKEVVVAIVEDCFEPDGLKKVKQFIEFVTLDIVGDLPRIGGWAVHSRVEPTEIAGENFVYTAKQFAPVERLRHTAMICEHCNHKRARSVVFLLQNLETGEQKLVGKTCLKDFLPGTNVEEVVKYLENLQVLSGFGEGEEEFSDYSGAPRQAYVYPVDMAVAEALVLIRKWGFVSKKMVAEREVDADFDKPELCATSNLMANTGRHRAKLYSEVEIGEVFEAGLVQAVIDFIVSKDAKSDFDYNLQLAVKLKAAPLRLLAFIAAGVNQYLRSIEKAAEKVNKANEHLGEVGKRLVFQNVKLVRCLANEGYYGTTYITGFEDEAGNSIVWFGSNKIDAEIGDVLTIKATVKKHDEFKGRNQTVVTRVAVVE